MASRKNVSPELALARNPGGEPPAGHGLHAARATPSAPGPAEDLLRVVGEDGAIVREPDPKVPVPEMVRWYRAMVLTRTFDEKAMMLQRQGRIGFHVPAFGEEAAHIGPVAALEADDWVFPSYRNPGIPILRGVPLRAMFDNLFGNSEDLARGRQMPAHYAFAQARFVSISSPIATQVVQAAGCAMAMKIRKDPHLAITFFGDGSTSANDFHTGLNFAGVFRAPVIFVCTNNQWAISVPLRGQTAQTSIASKAAAYGMPGVRVDGNDILALYRAAREAADRARAGKGPTLIEAVTYRMGPHSSSDDPKRYRPEAEVAAWKVRDPIVRFRKYLERGDHLSANEAMAIQRECESVVNDAAAAAEKSPPPPVTTLFDDVYAQLPAPLAEQCRALLDEERRKGAFENTSQAFPL